jgi:hypothetical protein
MSSSDNRGPDAPRLADALCKLIDVFHAERRENGQNGANSLDFSSSARLSCEGDRVSKRNLKATDLKMPDDLPAHPEWRAFSPLEEAVVRHFLAEDNPWLTTRKVAEALRPRESPEGRIVGVLANLVERQVLERNPNTQLGYRLLMASEMSARAAPLD